MYGHDKFKLPSIKGIDSCWVGNWRRLGGVFYWKRPRESRVQQQNTGNDR